MLELFLKLIDRGLELLRQKDLQHVEFFENVVEPLQSVFEKMYRDHLETFRGVRELLLKPNWSPTELIQFVEGRVLFEDGTTELLFHLTRAEGFQGCSLRARNAGRTLSFPRSAIGEKFQLYVSTMARCLVFPGSGDGVLQLKYYDGLRSFVRSSERDSHTSLWEGDRPFRELAEMVNSLHSFYALVTSEFLELKKLCNSSS